ncbi:DNA mismatch repair protein MutS [uncultured Tyzzerella sp.]|uniref:DNA mismatch repair protein MutS n=1 Tax=uncultured Tyzzerella sp. TaxID=2321398 RepID=UPI0029432527|nr:DNA mismatch repair protein MutS [uncultured Tyzzerella sp.]
MIEYTPMMNQYLEIKENYKDCLLFFRLGDFYELFFEDAVTTVAELDIVLTKKSCGKKDGEPLKVDMCGVPFHSADGYIAKLIDKGYKVAICEQVEDPKNMSGKIVKRDVVRVVTAGTVIDTNILEESKNNYIMCLFENKAAIGLSVCDVSTGEFLTIDFSLNEKSKVIDEIAKYNPSEIICNSKFSLVSNIEKVFNIKVYNYLDFHFEIDNAKDTLLKHFNVLNLSGFGIEEEPILISVSGALIRYLVDTQKNNLSHISNVKKYTTNKYMFLDISSRRNLELTETIREKAKKGSLLWVLDKTKTPMGARLIRRWIEQPLVDKDDIENRLLAVEYIKNNPLDKIDMTDYLSKIKDMERLIGKISYQTANARDLIALKNSFKSLPEIKQILLKSNTALIGDICNHFDTLEDLYSIIDSAIQEEPPFSIREGNMIKNGFNEQIDNFREAKNKGTSWLLDLEEKERQNTGIKNIKIRFNKVFGYYIEVTNSYLSLVPDTYIRKQTLANCERFVTDELKKIEEAILGADEKLVEVEYEEFCKVRNYLSDNIGRIQKMANIIATIDVLISFAEVAMKNNYKKPIILDDTEGKIDISLGRHPVVELLAEDSFIPNDTILDKDKNRLAIITGPNMAGKSTYMRQVALIVLMAQIGSFVPCDNATISIVDRIFTRVGASDDLATGQSTFMVEMTEVANIINNATDKSLLILDEIGRGTSTFDGLSIAWAVLEHIAEKIGARTLFATHYHELTEIEGKIDGVNNYCVEIKDNGDDIIFLRKIVKGGATGSYGIHVAKLAGIPNRVIARANEILQILNDCDATKISNVGIQNLDQINGDEEDFYYNASTKRTILFVDELEKELKSLDIDNISPREAWQKLFDIKNKLKNL